LRSLLRALSADCAGTLPMVGMNDRASPLICRKFQLANEVKCDEFSRIEHYSKEGKHPLLLSGKFS